MTFVSRGPANIGGCMLQIAVDPAAANRLYAVAAGGGCWRCDYALVQYPEFTTSSSGGILGIPGLSLDERTYAIPKWHPLSDREPVLHMTALALCNRHSSTLYVATGHYNRSWPAQLHRSDNGGASWVSPGSFNFTLVYRILVDPDDPARVYVASRAGFFGSADGGASFSLLYPGVIFDAAMDPDNASIIYIGVESVGVIKTTNARPAGGRFATVPFWHTVLPWSRANAPAGTMIRIGLGGGGSLTGRTVAVKFDQEVFVHRNSGVGDLLTWVSKGKPRAAGAQSRAGGQGDWDHVIAVDPVDDDVILVGAQNLFRTPDGGSTWTNVTGYDVSTHPDQQNVVFDPKLKGLVLLANDGGIFGSMDSGETWELDFNTGLVTAELFHAGVSGSYALSDMYHHDLVGSDTLETSVWSGTPGPYFGGSEFTDIYADLARPGRFYVFVPTRLALARWLTIPYAAGLSTDVWRRIDAEHSEFYDFNPNLGNFAARCMAFDLRPSSNTILVGTDGTVGLGNGQLMRALDGDAIAPTFKAEPGIDLAGDAIEGVALSPSVSGMAWAVSYSGQVFQKTDVNSSTAWKKTGASSGGNGVIGMAVNAHDAQRLYIVRDDGIEMTPDGGVSWALINGSAARSLPAFALRSIFAHPADGSVLIVGAGVGIFISTDEGVHWDLYDVGLPQVEVRNVFIANGTLYAATLGRGLWKRVVNKWSSAALSKSSLSEAKARAGADFGP